MLITNHGSENASSAGTRSCRAAFFQRMLCFLIVCMFLFTSFLSPAVLAQSSNPAAPSQTSNPAAPSQSASQQTVLIDPAGSGSPVIDGKAYVLYDAQSGAFLLGRNQDTPLPPASITKVMTVLLALEKLKLTDEITITCDMFESIPYDYVRMGYVAGEVITVEEALNACLLISANDAAMALAVKMGGSVDGFSQMMNARAAELGCLHTHFSNPYGLSEKEHLTTAHDMALILAEALKNEAYTRISTTVHYTMPATNTYNGTRGLTNSNRFVTNVKYDYANYIGGKTGYTVQAGQTIVAGARQNGRTLIGAILGASNAEIRYANLISLFNHGFTAFKTVRVEPTEYEPIKSQAVAEVTAAIEQAGNEHAIESVDVNLIPFTTTTNARNAGGYTCSIDMTPMSQAVVQSDLAKQVLHFPLFRAYADGTRYQVGTLNVALSVLPVAAASTIVPDQTESGLWGTIQRIAIIVLLVAILVFCILIVVMMEREKKRRCRIMKKPRITRC